MKKITKIILSAALLCSATATKVPFLQARAENIEPFTTEYTETMGADGLQIHGKSAYLIDFGTQTVVYALNEETHLPIASMCKIMTLLLSFEELAAERMAFDEEICVSERAASMGGSQVFLEANTKYPVKELLKSIVVCSANDSCVAMAERIAGSEDIFVNKMNEKAKELGANNTLFANCTGLPKEPQYSCAKDVAIMFKALLEHQEYFEFGKVWIDKFQHPKGRYTEISNTNKLVRFYDGCDGGKTGFTNEAGFCLAATAKRGNMRVISVVIGEETSKNRFNDVRTMFDYAFANYSVTPIVEANVPLEESISISGSKTNSIQVYPAESAYSFSKKGEVTNWHKELRLDKIKAPLEKDECVGELILFKNGVENKRIPLYTCANVQESNIFDRLKEIARSWNG